MFPSQVGDGVPPVTGTGTVAYVKSCTGILNGFGDTLGLGVALLHDAGAVVPTFVNKKFDDPSDDAQ